jgi:hypothetical protein
MPALIEPFFNTSGGVSETIKSNFQTRFDNLKAQKGVLDAYIAGTNKSGSNLSADINNLQALFESYVKSGGVNNAFTPSKPDGTPPSNTNTVSDAVETLNSKLKTYRENILNNLQSLRRDILATVDVNALTNSVSTQVQKIETLNKQIEEENNNLSTAFTRDAMLEHKDKAISYHQTWGFLQRPLRKQSMPYIVFLILSFTLLGIFGAILLYPIPEVDQSQQAPGESGQISASVITKSIEGIFSLISKKLTIILTSGFSLLPLNRIWQGMELGHLV